MRRIPAFRGYIFDLDGTVYRGDRLLPGARETIEGLRAAGRRVVFLSNKPIDTRESYARKLRHLGVPTRTADVINSSFVLARYLGARSPGARLFVIGERPLLAELRRAGFRIVANGDRADWVVIAFDRTFDYAKLTGALHAVRRGARLIATNPDRTCPVEGGEIPDCAAMIGAVEGATATRVEVIVGKPSRITLDVCLAQMGLRARDCLMIGDRLETDIRMAREAGMAGALVLTGVTDRRTLRRSPIQPDYVLRDLRELLAAR
ncbi:MAG: HAD-IIA family hydrolase [candidate division NC10 bacterium]|nr:HAD-IIA family hydrolase [candidate division NC10 bacterium]